MNRNQDDQPDMHKKSSRNREITEVDLYVFQLPQPQQEIVQRLRDLITDHYPELSETLKWHVPVYSLNKTNHLLGIQVFKRHVNLNFFKDTHLHDPQRIMVGSGERVRHISFPTINDVDDLVLRALIDQTIANEQMPEG